MIKPLLYIPIEVSRRALYPSLILGKLASDFGYRVIIISKHWFEIYLDNNIPLPPGLVYVKDLTHRSYFNGMRKAKSKGFKIICKFAECLDKADHNFIEPITFSNYLSECDALLASTNFDVITYTGLFKAKSIERPVYKFLDPRLDIISSNNINGFKKEINALKTLYGDFSVYAISSTPKGYDPSIRIQKLKKWFDGNNEISIDRVNEYIDFRMKMSSYYSKCSQEARTYLPELISSSSQTFLFSTHPARKSEAYECYSQIVEANQNCEFISFGSFEPKLLGCDKYYAGLCTSIMIPWVMGFKDKTELLCDPNKEMHQHAIYSSLNSKNDNCLEVISTNQDTVKLLDFFSQKLDRHESKVISEIFSKLQHEYPKSWKFLDFTDSRVQACKEFLCRLNKDHKYELCKLNSIAICIDRSI